MDKFTIILMFKLLAPIIILPIIGIFIYKFIHYNKNKRRKFLDNYIKIKKESKNNSSYDVQSQKFSDKSSHQNLEIQFPYKTKVPKKLSNAGGLGCIALLPSVLISYIGGIYFPILIIVLPLNIIVLILVFILISKSKKNVCEYLTISNHEIRIIDKDKNELLKLSPNEIKVLALYETMDYHKGIPRLTGQIIELKINSKNTLNKTSLFWNERHPLKGYTPFKSIDKKKLLRKEIIDFCLRNKIPVKNSI